MEGKSGGTSGGTGEGGSFTPAVSKEDYELLKKQNEETSNAVKESSNAIRELTALIKGIVGQGAMPFARPGGTIDALGGQAFEGNRNTIRPEPVHEAPRDPVPMPAEVVNVAASAGEQATPRQQPAPANRDRGKGIMPLEEVESTCMGRTRVSGKEVEDEHDSGNGTKMKDEMKKMLEEKKLGLSEEAARRNFPFMAEITEQPLPKHFQMPVITPFNGRGNPKNHVRMYEAMMGLHGLDEAIMCRAFPVSLTN